jgi:glutamate-1-semialdehyde 2,1-aminomutase
MQVQTHREDDYVDGLVTGRSRRHYEQASSLIPGGSSSHSHAAGTFEPYPIAFERGRGSHVWDLDGNEYIDYNLAMGPLVLGHCHPKLMSAVQETLENGTMFAMPCELELKAAQKVHEAVPNAEMVRFSNSGAEATQYAIRFARAFTGRDKVIKFEGGYHGAYDYVLLNTVGIGGYLGSEASPYRLPGSWGMTENSVKDTVIAPWNNLDALEKIVKKNEGQIAAVITEAVLSNIGCVPPEPGYLHGVQELCRTHNIVFILDEVMTGFRMAYGGAQEYYDLRPDLATFSKAIAGGFPVSAITGSRKIMELVVPGKVAHFGTYNGNPLCMAAVCATISELGADNKKGIRNIERLQAILSEGLEDALHKTKTEGIVQTVPGMTQIYFTNLKAIRNYRDYFMVNPSKFMSFHKEMLKRGTYFHPRQFLHMFTSTVHTEEDIQNTIEAAYEAMKSIA